MTPEEIELLERAAEAANPGPINAALRIELFPEMVKLVKRVIAQDRTYRPHRREIAERVKRVKTALIFARAELQDPALGVDTMKELSSALRELNEYMTRLD